MPVTDKYVAKQYFLELAGFTPYFFTQFVSKHRIEGTSAGYPIFAVMRGLLNDAKGVSESNPDSDVDTALKQAKLDQIRVLTQIKRKASIDRNLAVDRMRVTLQAAATKISYGAKQAAARGTGVMVARDLENIILECWESAKDSLLDEAERLIDWEKYGEEIEEAEGANLLSEGSGLAKRAQEDIGTGDSEEDSSTSEV